MPYLVPWSTRKPHTAKPQSSPRNDGWVIEPVSLADCRTVYRWHDSARPPGGQGRHGRHIPPGFTPRKPTTHEVVIVVVAAPAPKSFRVVRVFRVVSVFLVVG